MKTIKAKITSPNKRYTLRRHSAAPGFQSARSFRFAPFPRLPPPTFCQPWSCFASPYPGWQNVVYLGRYATYGLRFIKNYS
jgi:hypothetical protein